MPAVSPEVDRLLAANTEKLPLIRSALRPQANACSVKSQRASILFPGARHGEAALAGLLLRLGCWDESHNVSQEIHTPEGSYWHAIVHRMEPDSFNSGYWYRQTGKHAIFPELLKEASQILSEGGPKHWLLKAEWDPFLFVDWCDEARENGGQAEAAAVQIQMAEWQLLFDWCTAIDSR
jgi:hypothetical protein